MDSVEGVHPVTLGGGNLTAWCQTRSSKDYGDGHSSEPSFASAKLGFPNRVAIPVCSSLQLPDCRVSAVLQSRHRRLARVRSLGNRYFRTAVMPITDTKCSAGATLVL